MDYIQDAIRKKIADEIRWLELPPEWTPKDVINYIVSKIEKE
jgi:hypothetical protein